MGTLTPGDWLRLSPEDELAFANQMPDSLTITTGSVGSTDFLLITRKAGQGTIIINDLNFDTQMQTVTLDTGVRWSGGDGIVRQLRSNYSPDASPFLVTVSDAEKYMQIPTIYTGNVSFKYDIAWVFGVSSGSIPPPNEVEGPIICHKCGL